MAGDHEVLLIDEPEAFLHPSLSYFLGKEISRHIGSGKQLFAANHSPHFLMGCVDSGVEVDIVRLTYTNGVATARTLPSASLREIMADPLLKSIGVTSALFYESAIVCESDSDRAFYAEIASRLSDERGFRHTSFLNGHGKHTIPGIVSALRALGIPTAGVMDIDWIKEDGAVSETYARNFGVPPALKESFKSARRKTRELLTKASENYKREGGISLLSGDDLAAASDFLDMARKYGLFSVESGELESWLPETGASRNKTVWLQETFTAMGSDPSAVGYIHAGDDGVWAFMKQISDWLSDPNRRGMG